MKSVESSYCHPTTRRAFLATSSKALAGAALATAVARPGYVAEKNTIKIALIGCGSRGGGAAIQALSTAGPTLLWAAADVFESRLRGQLEEISRRKPGQVQAVPERQFVGLDGYRKAMDTLDKGDVVILATPPAFRPIHLEYAVQKGLHVFMEKSFAVDAPGCRRVLRAGELARQKNLKIAGGLMSRHYQPLQEAIQFIHDGGIGPVITTWAYRMHGPVGFVPRRAGESELAHQIRNYSNFTWLNGSFIVDWLIHNIDVACWVKNDWPVSVQGMGGRQVRREPDQLFDHYMAEYSFADGTRMAVQGRHQARCYDFWGVIVHGATGSAVLGEGQPNPRIFKGHLQSAENLIWRFKGQAKDQYQVEQDRLFEAIRNDLPYNETERCVQANLTAIMGRMACESGRLITQKEALESGLELAPGLENYTLESPPPPGARPDAQGNYPVAMPGQTVVL